MQKWLFISMVQKTHRLLLKRTGWWREGVGGGVLRLNKPNRNVPPHRVGFLSCFGLKTGTHFTHFGLESGMIFEGATECMNVFIVSIRNK